MPTFKFTAPDGRVIRVTGETPPTEADVDAMFAQTDAPKPAAPAVPERTWTDTAVDALPMAGGMLGGALGGLGGAAFGVGFGGVPGAVGGSALGGGAGEAARQLINRVRGKGAPSTPTEAATGIAGAGATQAVAEFVGQGVVKGAGAGAKAVYRGFLKPSLAKQSLGKADEIVETALKEGLPVTKAGREKARVLVNELKAKVDDILKEADATGETVDLSRAASKVRAFAKEAYYKAGKPSEEYAAALKVAEALEAHPSLGGVTNVPLTQANKVKRGLDQSVGESAFGIATGNATKAAQKVARSTIRQDIELGAEISGAGRVGPLNAREGRLLDAAKAINRAVGRESNKSPLIGVNTMLAGAVGAGSYAKDRDPYTAAARALATRALLTPEVATRVAIVAYKLGKNSGAGPANVARLALQAVLADDQPPQ